MVGITSQMNTRIRLVRCPTCRKVLPELPDIPVYKCGGCGTILQAKNQKNDIKETDLSSHETNSLQNYEDECVSDSSNQEATLPVLESSPGTDYKGDQYETENHNEQPGDKSFSGELRSSSEHSYNGTDKLSPEARESMEQGEDKCPLSQDARKDENESLNHNSEQPGDRTSSDEVPDSGELICCENEDSSPETRELSCNGTDKLSPEARKSMEQGEDKCLMGQDARKDENESLNRNSEQPGDRTSSDDLPDSSELVCCENEDSSPEIRELSCSGTEKLSPEARKSMEQGEDKCPMGQDARKDENESLNRNSEQPGDRTSSDELPDSSELICCENEESSPEIREPMKQDEDRSLTKQDSEKYAKESQDGCSEQSGDRKFSDELHSSADLSQNIEISSPEVSKCIKLNGEKDLLELHLSGNQNEGGECKADKPEGNNFLTNVPSTCEGNHQNELSPGGGAHTEVDESFYLSEKNNEKSQRKSAGQIEESSQNREVAREASSSAQVAFHKVETSSMIAKTYTDVHEDNMSYLRSSDVQGSLSPKKVDAIIAAQSPLNEGILSENLSPDDKYLEKSQRRVQGFDRVSSAETFESLPVITRYTLGAMSKSPTRIYYARDASESSYDGTNDQPSHLYKRKSKATDLLTTHRSRRKDGYRVNKIQNYELEMHHEGTASSSTFAEKNNHAFTGREWSHDELPEPRRHAHSIRRRMRLDNDDPISRKSRILRSSQLVHGSGSPSSYRNNGFQQHPGFHSPDTISYIEPDKMELLRMVYELEDKLNRTHTSKGMENRRFSAEDLAREGNVYADFINPKYHDSYTQGIGWSQQSKISRMAFSGEAACCRHQVDCLCSHCCPHDRQSSRYLPSHSISRSKCQYAAHPSHNRHKAFPSRSLTPQHYTSSEFSSWGQEMKSDSQKYQEHELKRLHLREKYHVAKRHLRPIAGGAPVIACCHCSELLQLPVDFLVFKKRCHQLRCNSCYRIQKYSLQKKVHLVPYVPNASTPPPSEVDDDSGAANSRTLAPTSHSNHLPHAEPVSCSDDYDPSFCRSCSTERDPSMLTPASHSLQKNTDNAKMSGRNMNSVSGKSRSMYKNSGKAFESVGTSSQMSKWGKSSSEIQELPADSGKASESVGTSSQMSKWGKSSSEIQELPVDSGKAFESVGTSSQMPKWGKSSSEIQELPAASGSPLHRLMGYSSPSQVLYAYPSDESGEEMRYRNQ